MFPRFWSRANSCEDLALVLTVHATQVIATVKLGVNGVRFTIEEAQAFQANALLARALFREYELDVAMHGEPVFGVPFDTLLDVLNVFGSAAAAQRDTGLRMAYSAQSSDRLLLVLTHGDGKAEVLTTCKLRTLDVEMPMSIGDLMHATRVNQLIMSAAALKDAFGELDWSTSQVSLLLSPGEPYFQLSTGGKNGSCEVSYSKDSDVISNFSVPQHQVCRAAAARAVLPSAHFTVFGDLFVRLRRTAQTATTRHRVTHWLACGLQSRVSATRRRLRSKPRPMACC